MTRIIWSRRELERDEASNDATQCFDAPRCSASRNGSWSGADRVRATRLLPGLRLCLAGKATVEWRPIH